MDNNNIVLVTGGFDPLHSGHLALIKAARSIGRVMVGVNSDQWLTKKKGQHFMPIEERLVILNSLKDVMGAFEFDDSDGSACEAINYVKKMFPTSKVIFANGGDRTSTNIPELQQFENDDRVEFMFGVGGEDKKNSSSWILSEWKHPSENRFWGKSLTYYESNQSKVKRLELDPGKSISMQYHNHRNEFWFIEEGEGVVHTETSLLHVTKHDTYMVKKGQWHRLENVGTNPLHVIEIQYGDVCTEDDIVRL